MDFYRITFKLSDMQPWFRSWDFSACKVSASDILQGHSVSRYIVDYLWDQPAIYCGTYKKYNEGSLFGAWLDLRTFDSYEEFIDVCKQLHAEEEDPELMFQDYRLLKIVMRANMIRKRISPHTSSMSAMIWSA